MHFLFSFNISLIMDFEIHRRNSADDANFEVNFDTVYDIWN